MGILLGMHCMYCDNGPCNGECDAYKSANVYQDSKDKIREVFKWLSEKDYLSDDWELIYNEFIKEKNNL